MSGGCGQSICYHVAAFVIPFYFDMQHVLKKLSFDLLATPSGLGAVGLHVAAFVIPFN